MNEDKKKRKEELDNVVNDYFENVIKKSWTWEKLTAEEKTRFTEMCVFKSIKGNKKTRVAWMWTIYHAFLVGVGCDSCCWRREDNEPKF